VASALPRGALLLTGIYVARASGHEAFADYSLAIATVTLAGGTVGTALMNLGSKRVPELAHRHGAHGAGFASLLAFGAALALMMGIALLALAPALSAGLGRGEALTETLRVASLVVGAMVIHGSLNGLTLGSARFATAGLSAVIGTVAFAALLLPMTFQWGMLGTMGAIGLLYAVMAAFLTSVVGPLARGDVGRPERPKWLSQWQPSAAFLAPIILYTAVFPVVVWVANLLLARGPDAVLNIARFNAAYNWYAIATFVPTVMIQVEFVHLSRARASGQGYEFLRLLRYAVLQNMLVMAALVVAGTLLAGPLMSLFRVDDADGRLCLRLLFLAALFIGTAVPLILAFTIMDKVWIATAHKVGWGLLTHGIACFLRDLGAVAIGIAFAAAYAAHVAVTAMVAIRLMRQFAPANQPASD
jgi:O-antigen/teichoic acid export membrane protein